MLLKQGIELGTQALAAKIRSMAISIDSLTRSLGGLHFRPRTRRSAS